MTRMLPSQATNGAGPWPRPCTDPHCFTGDLLRAIGFWNFCFEPYERLYDLVTGQPLWCFISMSSTITLEMDSGCLSMEAAREELVLKNSGLTSACVSLQRIRAGLSWELIYANSCKWMEEAFAFFKKSHFLMVHSITCIYWASVSWATG